jgi:hypothetical protein
MTLRPPARQEDEQLSHRIIQYRFTILVFMRMMIIACWAGSCVDLGQDRKKTCLWWYFQILNLIQPKSEARRRRRPIYSTGPQHYYLLLLIDQFDFQQIRRLVRSILNIHFSPESVLSDEPWGKRARRCKSIIGVQSADRSLLNGHYS